MGEEKLSKKQLKAISFRKSKDERSQEKLEKKTKKSQKSLKRKRGESLDEETFTPETHLKPVSATGDGEPEKKKRKTRRGKKGKGVNEGKGPRFILFVGNLPYDTQQVELDTHFKNVQPDRIRIRREKGIAFLEFDNDSKAMQSKMDNALGMHHLIFRNRKINVELTAGGGGNSEVRQQKLKKKNEKLSGERKEKAKKELAKRTQKGEINDATVSGGMHPARAAMLRQ